MTATIATFPAILALDAYTRPTSMPNAIAEVVVSWARVSRSPFSDSFYSFPGKTWDHTPEGIVRASDHWNFTSRGEVHCRTDIPVPNNTHWTLAERVDGHWRVLQTLPRTTPAEAAAIHRAEVAHTVAAIARWRPTEQVVLRLFMAKPVAMASDVLGRDDAAHRHAVARLLSLDLLRLIEVNAGGTLPPDAPAPVTRFFAAHPKARKIYWLTPDHRHIAEAVAAAWDAADNQKVARQVATVARRHDRLAAVLTAAYPSMPSNIRTSILTALASSHLPRGDLTVIIAPRAAIAADHLAHDAIAGDPATMATMATCTKSERRARMAPLVRDRAQQLLASWRATPVEPAQ